METDGDTTIITYNYYNYYTTTITLQTTLQMTLHYQYSS